MLFLRRLSRFLRLAAAGATIAIPLLGAVTALANPPLITMAGIALVGVSHHVFSFVLNDVVDLPIDSTEPRRARSPLVQCLVSPRLALVIALVNVPLVLWLSFLIGAGPFEQALLVASLLLITAYDVWGKKTRVPPVIDAIQGVGWAFFAWYGAEIAGGATTVTVLFCAFLVGYITLANGVHGGFRDLENDQLHQARTTPLFFDAEPLGNGAATCPPALRRYALALETVDNILIGTMIIALGYDGWTLAYAVVAWLGVAGLSGVLLRRALDATGDRERMMVLGATHLIISFAVAIAVLIPVMPPAILVFVLGVYVTPLLAYGWLFDAILRVPEPRSAR